MIELPFARAIGRGSLLFALLLVVP